jgi:hypothetical protein
VTALQSCVARTAGSRIAGGNLWFELLAAITRITPPDPVRAVSLGLQALSIAQDAGSARVLRELRTLGTRLTGTWSNDPACRIFRGALVAA